MMIARRNASSVLLLPAAAMSLALLACSGPGPQAQQQPAPQAPMAAQTAPTAQPPAVNDGEIQSFASAASEVQQLSQKWMPKLQAAAPQGAEAQSRIRAQANAEMVAAVQRNGLSVEQYNQIAQLAQNDPNVASKIKARMRPPQ